MRRECVSATARQLAGAIAVAIAMAIPIPRVAQAADASSADTRSTEPATSAEVTMTYWLEHREGWFWYRDPAPAKPRTPAAPALSAASGSAFSSSPRPRGLQKATARRALAR